MAWPTTSDPKTEFATIRFTLGESAEVDSEAAKAGMNRSQYIRECVHRCIVADRRKNKKVVRAEDTKHEGD